MPKQTPSPSPRWRWGLVVAVWGVFILIGLFGDLFTAGGRHQIPYSEFRDDLAAGRVTEVSVSTTSIDGRLAKDGGAFRTVRVEDPELVKDLIQAKVKITGIAPSGWTSLIWWLVPIVLLWAWLGPLLRGRGGRGAGLLSVGQSRARVYMEKDVKVTFADVAGVDEAKEELHEVIDFLGHPERFRRLGGKLPKGILLVGPPGTGKTLLARAVAGEAGVTFFSISGSEFVELFVGVGAARVRDLFAQARDKAPCIIFIDELDALGKVRGVGPNAHEEREQTLNQLLVELDGFDPRDGVVLMAATNRPEILDPALLRAGRFDRHVLVDRPDKAGRLAILKVHARDVLLEREQDLEAVASATAGLVGADLANLLNEAALLAVRRGKEKVTHAELEEAIERVVAGLAKRSRVLQPDEKERIAHHEVGHALVTVLTGAGRLAPVTKVSIIPRGISALGYTLQTPAEERFLLLRHELHDKIAVLLAGRTAEELVFGEASTGAQDDLLKATSIARAMVKSFGMSASLGVQSFAREPHPLFLDAASAPGGDYSDATAREIDAEVSRLLEAQRDRVRELLGGRLPLVRRVATALLEKETLSGDELAAFVAADGQGLARVA
jgi:cell division protease FtsH